MTPIESRISTAATASIRRPWFGSTRASTPIGEPRPHLTVLPPPSPGRRFAIRVLIADDDEMIRRTLIEAMEQADGLSVIATANDADEAIRLLALRHPDVVRWTYACPRRRAPAARESTWRSPQTRIVALSAHDDPRCVDDMLASGARSYLVKDASTRRERGGDRSLRRGRRVPLRSRHRTCRGRTGKPSRRRADGRPGTTRTRERIQRFIHGAPELAMVYQPIVELASGRIVGLEALARFHGEPARSPDAWFVEAAEVGLSAQLQATALRKGCRLSTACRSTCFLSVNVDPRDVASPELLGVLEGCPAERIVIELTEHSAASDYPRLRDALDPLRAIRLEAGGGPRGRRILELQAHPRARAGHHQARHQHRAERRPGTVPSGARCQRWSASRAKPAAT